MSPAVVRYIATLDHPGLLDPNDSQAPLRHPDADPADPTPRASA